MQEYYNQGKAILLSASALALAPWDIGGIVFGARWWRSRGSQGREDAKRDAG